MDKQIEFIKSKPIMSLAIVFILIITIQYLSNYYLFFTNDEAVISEIKQTPLIKEYQEIELHNIMDGQYVVNELMNNKDINGTKITNYNRYIRPFNAWKYPRNSVEEDENWVAFGFIDLDKRVFIKYIKKESDLTDTI